MLLLGVFNLGIAGGQGEVGTPENRRAVRVLFSCAPPPVVVAVNIVGRFLGSMEMFSTKLRLLLMVFPSRWVFPFEYIRKSARHCYVRVQGISSANWI